MEYKTVSQNKTFAMIDKIVQITEIGKYYCVCRFSSGIKKKLNIEPLIKAHAGMITKDLFDFSIFSQVNIGDFGQLYWSDAATMKDENGALIPCEYDISSEYVYHHGE